MIASYRRPNPSGRRFRWYTLVNSRSKKAHTEQNHVMNDKDSARRAAVSQSKASGFIFSLRSLDFKV